MADYEDGIFSNLPRPRRRPGQRDDDDRRLSPRQLLAMNFMPEGPLPQRPRSSGKGGPSVGQRPTGTATLLLYTGESNAGGLAPNSACSTSDLLPHPNIQILNNTTMTLQTLQIGVNNLIGHSGLTDNVSHGCELGWAIAAEAGRFANLPVFLVKTGQGGSVIANWTVGNATGFWTTLVTRYNAVVAAIQALGYSNINTVVMYSQGINDIGASTPPTTWQAATQAFFANQLRPLIGVNTPIIMSHFNGSGFTQYEGVIDAIAVADPLTKAMSGDPTGWQADNEHRNYAGYRNWAECYLDSWFQNNGTAAAPGVSPPSGSFSPNVTVTITPAGGEKIYYSSDGSDPLTFAQIYSGPLTLTTPVGVKARGVLPNLASSAIVGVSYTALASSTWSPVDAGSSMTLSNGGLTVTPTGHTWTSIRTTLAQSSGNFYVEFKNSAAVTINTEMIGIAGNSFNPGNYLGSNGYSFGAFPGGIFATGMTGTSATYPTNPVSGDVWALAINFTTGNVWLAQNNVWLTGIGGSAGNPAAGTFPYVTFQSGLPGPLFPAMSFDDPGGGVWTLQPTAASQKYLPPPGFQAWDGGPVTPSTSVWSASDAAANAMTLSNGGLTVVSSTTTSTWGTVRTSTSKTTGKYYIEFLITISDGGYAMMGLGSAGMNIASFLGNSNFSCGIQNTSGYTSSGFTNNYWVAKVPAVNDVFALAVDFNAGSLWIAQNNVWVNGSNPATASLPIISFVPATVGALFAGLSMDGIHQAGGTLQPTAATQKYAPPAGFTPWG